MPSTHFSVTLNSLNLKKKEKKKEQIDKLDAPLTENELSTTTHHMANNKSPGPDASPLNSINILKIS